MGSAKIKEKTHLQRAKVSEDFDLIEENPIYFGPRNIHNQHDVHLLYYLDCREGRKTYLRAEVVLRFQVSESLAQRNTSRQMMMIHNCLRAYHLLWQHGGCIFAWSQQRPTNELNSSCSTVLKDSIPQHGSHSRGVVLRSTMCICMSGPQVSLRRYR